MSKKIIIDIDSESIDILALFLSVLSPEIDILAITTTYKSYEKILEIKQAYDLDIPIGIGTRDSLMKESSSLRSKFAGNNNDYVNNVDIEKVYTAVEIMDREIRAAKDKVILFSMGPLTNIASLLLSSPDLEDNIEDIYVFSGKNLVDNMSYIKNYNLFLDPESAEIVFRSGMDIKIFESITNKDISDSIINETLLRCINKLSRKPDGNYYDSLSSIKLDSSDLQGLLPIIYLIDEELFEVESCYIEVELENEILRGITIIDKHNIIKRKNNAHIIECIDYTKVIELIGDKLEIV